MFTELLLKSMRVFFCIINNLQDQWKPKQILDVLDFTVTFQRFCETNRLSQPGLL